MNCSIKFSNVFSNSSWEKHERKQWHSDYPECTCIQSWNREEQRYITCHVTEMCIEPILVSKTLTARGRCCCDLGGGRLSNWISCLGWISSWSAGFCDFNEGNRPWPHSVAVGQNAVYYRRSWCYRTWIRTSVGLFGGNTKVYYTLNVHLEKQLNRF